MMHKSNKHTKHHTNKLPIYIKFMKNLKNVTLRTKLYQILISIIMVVLLCTIRYIFIIEPWDLLSNIFPGVSCVFVRLVLIDFIKEWLVQII
jgi:hypothetical protein